jgi:LPXTG-motif cell wall-anchored protein
MITHPTSAYSPTEIAAITKFVTAGGSLLMTEKSNFGGTNQNLNDILSSVGSSILVNNDGVFDETIEGNFWGTPLTSNFSVRLHPTPVSNTLTDFVPTIEYYSGSSLAKNDGTGKKVALTDSGSVTILARGNESTFQDSPTIKADSVSYNVRTAIKGGPALVDVTGGSIIPLIASEEIGNGRVVVSAMNVFNDKQMDQTYNSKGNDQFAVNAVNWLTHLEPKVQSIGDARKLAEGTNVVAEGTVTTTAFFDSVYIQDNTGGIMAFNDVPVGSLQIGDKVRIYGHIKVFENNFELEFGSFEESVVKLGAGTPVEPKLVSTKDSNAEENQGQLVKVIGKVVSKYDENSYMIDDGTGETLVFTDGYIINQSGPVPNLKVGDTLEAVGLTGKFSEGKRIRVRNTKELVGTVADSTDVTAPAAPVVNGVTDADVVIKGTAEAGSTVVAKVANKEIGRATADQSGKFEIAIAKQAAGVKISVTATDAASNQSAATEVTVTDVTAPAAPVVNGVTDKDVFINGTAEAGATVVAKVAGLEIGRAKADKNGNFEIKISKLAAGTKIVVTATDIAGNTSTAQSVEVAKKVTKPTEIKPKVISGVAKLDSQTFDKALEDSIQNGSPLVVDLGNNNSAKVEFTKEQVQQLKESGIPLIVKNNDVQMDIPLDFVAAGQTLDVSTKRLTDIKEAKSSVYEFTVIVDGKEVHQFADPITLTFEVVASKVKNTKDLKVFYYNEQTKEWQLVPGAVYKDGKVEVKTNHFSTFAVFEVAGDNKVALDNGAKSDPGKGLPNTATNTYNLLFAGLFILVLGFALVFARRRKQA